MVDSRDQLFLRLAIRQGLFSKQEATELLAYYRENAGVNEGIGQFLLREGYIDENTAEVLRSAIAQRAEGHVTSTRKRVPRLNKTRSARGAATAGHHPVHHHVSARPARIQADGLHIALVGIGAAVLIGAVIWIALEMSKNTQSATDAMKQSEQARDERRAEAAEKAKREREARERAEARIASEPVPVTFTPEELKKLNNRASDIRTSAYQASVDKGPAPALEFLAVRLDAMRQEKAPDSVLKILEDVRKELQETLKARYTELHEELQEARTEGDAAKVEDLLLTIEETCGKEYRTKAEKQ